MLVWTLASSIISLLVSLILSTQQCCSHRPRSNRAANLSRMRNLLRYICAFVCLVQGVAGLITSQCHLSSIPAVLMTNVRSIPQLASLSLCGSIGFYLLQCCRLVSGTGDDSGRLKVRYIQIGSNVTLYVVYLVCAIASAVVDPQSTWRWMSYLLGISSLIGAVALVLVGCWLLSLIKFVPDLESSKRDAIISRTKKLVMVTVFLLALRGFYNVILATSLLGNVGPYPVRGDVASINPVIVDLAEAGPMIITFLLMMALLYITSKKKKKKRLVLSSRSALLR